MPTSVSYTHLDVYKRQVKKVDEYERMIIMGDGKQIPIDEVIDVDCDVFGEPC